LHALTAVSVAIIAALGTVTPAGAFSDSFNITLNVNAGPPQAVTDLACLSSATEGEIALNWTAPSGEPANAPLSQVAQFEIRYATFSVSDLSNDTTAWWISATGSEIFPPVRQPGEIENTTIGMPLPGGVGVVYYFAIRSYDGSDWSDYDDNAYDIQASTTATDLTPEKPTNLALVSKTTSYVSIQWNNMAGNIGYADFDYYRIYRSITSGIYGSSIAITTLTNYTDSSVIIDTTYYYRISAVDGPPSVLESELSNPTTVYVPMVTPPKPQAPTGVTTAITDADNFTVNWNMVSTAVKYWVCISSVSGSGPWTNISTVTAPATEYSGSFDNLASSESVKIYYVVVKSVNEYDMESDNSDVKTIVQPEPEEPRGILAQIDGNKFGLIWNAVATAFRYEIQMSTVSINGPWTTSATVTSNSYTYPDNLDTLPAGKYYFVVKAINKRNVESKKSQVVFAEITAPGQLPVIIIVDVQLMQTGLNTSATVEMNTPLEVYWQIDIDELRSEGRPSEINTDSGDILVYEVVAYKNNTVKTIVRRLPRVIRQVLYYTMQNTGTGMGAQEYKDSAIGGLSDVCVYWHNGIDWKKIGGKVESEGTDQRKITFNIVNTGKYKLARTLVTGDFDVELVPPKIFAPRDTDATLKQMEFWVKNPTNSTKLTGKIYDLTGAVVGDIKYDRYSDPYSVMYWDGQDSNGKYVRGGVYIYQIEMDGKVVNGTIVVAK